MESNLGNVAIACQGGGSHTAFTAGALKRLLRRENRDPEYEITALSGTSGGAVCALVAWYAMRTADANRAAASLGGVWEDLSSTRFDDALVNDAIVAATQALDAGFPVWQFSPYDTPGTRRAQRRLRRAIERYVDPERIETLFNQPEPPMILISAVDIHSGRFETFSDRYDAEASDTRFDVRPKPLTIDAVLASAAVPTLFEAVEIDHDGHAHAYWDGLFSQNPPVRNLLTGSGAAEDKPDEIWVIRINPEKRTGAITQLDRIADRRNELAGSLSLHQELHFIETVNEWIENEMFSEAATERYKPVTVRQIELDENRLGPSAELLTASKLDRRPSHIERLQRMGELQADEFLRDPDAYSIIG